MANDEVSEKKPKRKQADAPRFDRHELGKSLKNIYQDESGELPNMKEITIKRTSPFVRFLTYVLGLGVILSLLAWIGLLVAPHNQTIADSQIDFTITGASEPTIDADDTYTVHYVNHYNVPLNNVTIDVYYPDNFNFENSDPAAENSGHNEWTIPSIPAGGTGSITITGRQYGNAGDTKSWRGFITYTPSNFNSQLQKAATMVATLQTSPLMLSVSGPDQTTVGTPATYTFTIATTTAWSSTAFLIPELPSNFSITTTTPPLVKNRWSIDLSNPSTTLTYTLKGTFGSASSSTVPVKGRVALIENGVEYPLNENSVVTSLTKNNLGFTATINGSTEDNDAEPGETMAVSLALTNTTAAAIKNGVVKLTFNAPSINRQSAPGWSSTGDPANGDIVGEQLSDSVRAGHITWSSKQIPALASIPAGKTVTTTFTLPIKATADFNFASLSGTGIITAAAEATFTDSSGKTQDITLSPITLTLQSDLGFKMSDNKNTTAHTITWTLSNSLHPLTDITVKATAYGDVAFAQNTVDSGTLSFDPGSKQVTWTIPAMSTDVNSQSAAFTLNLSKVNPSQTMLLSAVSVQATDQKTGKVLKITGQSDQLTQ